MTISNKNDILLTATSDPEIKIWDTQTLKEVGTFKGHEG
jgi:WD40 repeat protein